MYVYRVQRRSDGSGPYRGTIQNAGGFEPHAHGKRPKRFLPVVWADNPPVPSQPSWPANRFGFATLGQLRYWFNKADRKRLKRYGFEVCRYRLKPSPDTIAKAGHQVVFNPYQVAARRTPLDIVTLRPKA